MPEINLKKPIFFASSYYSEFTKIHLNTSATKANTLPPEELQVLNELFFFLKKHELRKKK
jgi:hypothetical protein